MSSVIVPITVGRDAGFTTASILRCAQKGGMRSHLHVQRERFSSYGPGRLGRQDFSTVIVCVRSDPTRQPRI